MPLDQTRHASFAIAAPDSGVCTSRQLHRVTAIWQMVYQLASLVSE